jgi:hypothetical protein
MVGRMNSLPEHSRVRSTVNIHDAEETVPLGAEGTIINVIRGGIGYIVEFTKPAHKIVSARRDELEPIDSQYNDTQ